jgi:hypothetical protein
VVRVGDGSAAVASIAVGVGGTVVGVTVGGESVGVGGTVVGVGDGVRVGADAQAVTRTTVEISPMT